MASFFNQATLVFGGRRSNSNVTQSEIVDTLSLTKTAISENYSENGTVTYTISIVNAGASDAVGLNLTDNLGAYELGDTLLYPLDYVDGSVRYFIDGVLQAAPAVTAGPPLTITGLNVPAGSNALIIYEARTNEFAPLASGSSISNEVSSAGEFCATLTDTATVPVREEAIPVITKFTCGETVVCGGEISYTFVLQNLGNITLNLSRNLLLSCSLCCFHILCFYCFSLIFYRLLLARGIAEPLLVFSEKLNSLFFS